MHRRRRALGDPLAQSHPRLVYRLLFQAAASTPLRFGRDPQHLGGVLGVTAILHTWRQNLSQHVHVHCIVTGGALAPDGRRWLPARPGFLFPVRALAKVFRGTYLAALQRAFDRGKLHLTASLAAVAAPAAFTGWLTGLRRQAWMVYCKPPFAGPDHVLAYLGRYTHRVALSNERLLAFDENRVRFRWRDYADGDRVKVMDLDVEEFLRRFLLHVVPDGFVRIRHFGLLANRRRAANLGRCRTLLAQAPLPAARALRVSARGHAARDRHRHRPLPGLPAGRAPAHRAPAPHLVALGHVLRRRCPATVLAPGPPGLPACSARLRPRHLGGPRGHSEPADAPRPSPADTPVRQRRLVPRSASPPAPGF